MIGINHNLFAIPDTEIHKTEVDRTVFEGEVVYSRERSRWRHPRDPLIGVGVGLVLTACDSLPPKVETADSHLQELDPGSRLAQLTREILSVGPGTGSSAFLLIDRNSEALAWRLALIDSAENTLDL